MERPWLARAAPGLAVLGAILGVAGDAYHLVWAFTDLGDRADLVGTVPYRAHGLLIALGYGLVLAALAGILSWHGPRLGRAAATGAALAFVGTTLVAGDYWAESVVVSRVVETTPQLADADPAGAYLVTLVVAFALCGAGWALYGWGLFRSRLVRGHVAALLVVGGAIAFTPLPGSNVLLFVAVAALALDGRGPTGRTSTGRSGSGAEPPSTP